MNPPSHHHNHRDLSWLDHISQNILIIIGSRKQKQPPLNNNWWTYYYGKLSSGDNINSPPELLQFIFIELANLLHLLSWKKFHLFDYYSRQFWSTCIVLRRWARSRKSTENNTNWPIIGGSPVTRQSPKGCCNNNRDLLTSLMTVAPTHPIIIITTTRASPEISRHTASDWTHLYIYKCGTQQLVGINCHKVHINNNQRRHQLIPSMSRECSWLDEPPTGSNSHPTTQYFSGLLTRTALNPQNWLTHRRVPPELDQVMDVRCGCQQEEVPPLVETNRQSAILVHAVMINWC